MEVITDASGNRAMDTVTQVASATGELVCVRVSAL